MSEPSPSLLYLDSSALVKLVIEEPESDGLRRFLAGRRHLLSSSVARVEVPRAVRAVADDEQAVARSVEVVTAVGLVPAELAILEHAAVLGPPRLRSLDALHLATALSLGDDLEAVLVYDARLADAARTAGLDVRAPD